MTTAITAYILIAIWLAGYTHGRVRETLPKPKYFWLCVSIPIGMFMGAVWPIMIFAATIYTFGYRDGGTRRWHR